MKIWLINQYNMPPEYGHLNRHFNFGKYLKRMGHEPTVFVGSFLHNTKIQMIENDSLIKKYKNVDYPYYFIKTCDYSSSRLKRIYAMYEFYKNFTKAVKLFDKPDAILGSSAHPLAAIAAIRLGKKYGCQSIVEVRDLWPESFVAYGLISKKNPLLRLFYAGEKWIYKNADKLIFTMEGGKEYIIEQGWGKEQGGPIDINKVHHINNGVDLEVFNYNKEHYILNDKDLEDKSYFRVVYVGSLRKANEQIWKLFDAIKLMQGNQYENIKFLIYGDGSEREKIIKYCEINGLKNVYIKGHVEKKYIPHILTRCDLNILNCTFRNILRFGGSQNKLFDYLASGNPIITGEDTKYSIVKKYKCGIAKNFDNAEELKEAILEIRDLDINKMNEVKKNIISAASKYDFKKLAEDLIYIIENQEVDNERKNINTGSTHR